MSKEETNNKNNDFDFDIREDTECIPSMNEIKKGVLQQKKMFRESNRSLERKECGRGGAGERTKVMTKLKCRRGPSRL